MFSRRKAHRIFLTLLIITAGLFISGHIKIDAMTIVSSVMRVTDGYNINRNMGCHSWNNSITPDGRYITFTCTPSSFSSFWQIYRHDTLTRETVLVSSNFLRQPGNHHSHASAISNDGRYVTFQSTAKNFVDDTNDNTHIFVKDMDTGSIEIVSVSSSGVHAKNQNYIGSISSSGRYVTFAARASNTLIDGQSKSANIYLHDRVTKTTKALGGIARTDMNFMTSDISSNEKYVVFSSSEDLTSSGVSGSQIYRYDIDTEQVILVSKAPSGGIVNGHFTWPSISANGDRIAFITDYGGPNLLLGEPAPTTESQKSKSQLMGCATENTRQVILRVISENLTICTTYSANGDSYSSKISDDGKYIAFLSVANNLLPLNDPAPDTNNKPDVYRYSIAGGGLGAGESVFVRASLNHNGQEILDGVSWNTNTNYKILDLTADGKKVVFYSTAKNFASGDNDNLSDVFMRDIESQTTMKASLNIPVLTTGSPSTSPAISADGRYVAFESDAANLVTDDLNGKKDVFWYDSTLNITKRVSVPSTGLTGESNGESYSPTISADGRYVAFLSNATNLVAGDTNEAVDAFRHDTLTGETIRVSVDSSGSQLAGFMPAGGVSATATDVAISGNGCVVAFASRSSNVVSDISYASSHTRVYSRNVCQGQTNLISRASNTEDGNGNTVLGTQASSTSSLHGRNIISNDGRFILFRSAATNLVPGDTNAAFGAGGSVQYDAFVRDTTGGTTRRVSVSSSGVEINGDVTGGNLSISSGGTYVVFSTNATNLDDKNLSGIFRHDILTGQTKRVSFNENGTPFGNIAGDSVISISSNGRYIAFATNSAVINADTNTFSDIFVRDMQTNRTTRVSRNMSNINNPGGGEGNGASILPSISADGRRIAFASSASNLVSGDNNGAMDIFLVTLIDANNPTVNEIRTNNPRPTITGWWDTSEFQNLSVTINSVVYTLGVSPALTSGGGNWSLNLSLSDQKLPVGIYDVVAMQSNSFGAVLYDETTNEVEIYANIPTVNPITTTDNTPTITGTWDEANFNELSISIDGREFLLSQNNPALTTSNGQWSLDLYIADFVLSCGTYDVEVVSSDTNGLNSELEDETLDEVIINGCTPEPPDPPCGPSDTDPSCAAPPTAESLRGCNANPTITGTWDSFRMNELTVTINGVTYVLGVDTALTSSGNNWTLNLNNSQNSLPRGAHILTVVSRNGNVEMSGTGGYNHICSNPPVCSPSNPDPSCAAPPTVNPLNACDVVRPTITGTWDSFRMNYLSVTIEGRTYVLGQNSELTRDGDNWTLDLSAINNPLTNNTAHYILVISKNGDVEMDARGTFNNTCPEPPNCGMTNTDPSCANSPMVVSDNACNSRPIIKGTWDSLRMNELSVWINGVTYVLGQNSELTRDGDNWTLDLSGVSTELLAQGYGITATSKNGDVEMSGIGTFTNSCTTPLPERRICSHPLADNWHDKRLDGPYPYPFNYVHDDSLCKYEVCTDPSAINFDAVRVGILQINNRPFVDTEPTKCEYNNLNLYCTISGKEGFTPVADRVDPWEGDNTLCKDEICIDCDTSSSVCQDESATNYGKPGVCLFGSTSILDLLSGSSDSGAPLESSPLFDLAIFATIMPFLAFLLRKHKPWGTVYNSVNKKPISFVKVYLKNKDGEEIASTTTNLYGEYEFFVPAGVYKIEVAKERFKFPSTRLPNSLTEDGVYKNIYFGGEFSLEKDNHPVYKDIPIDMIMSPDEATSAEMEVVKQERRKRAMKRVLVYVLNFVFFTGFAFMIYVVVQNPTLLNFAYLAIYIILLILSFIEFHPHFGKIKDRISGHPLSFGFIKIVSNKDNKEVASYKLDDKGKYVTMLPEKGEYSVRVFEKISEHSYQEVYDSNPILVKRPYLGEGFKI